MKELMWNEANDGINIADAIDDACHELEMNVNVP